MIGHVHETSIAGDDAARRVAREQLRRDARMRIAMKAPWPELKRSDLEFGRYTIRHVPTETLYKQMLGEVGEQHCPAVAYYVDAAGDVVFLERA